MKHLEKHRSCATGSGVISLVPPIPMDSGAIKMTITRCENGNVMQKSATDGRVQPSVEAPLLDQSASQQEVAMLRMLLTGAGKVYLAASGHCMSPCICDGDIIVLKAALVSQMKRGDILAYARQKSLYIHRLVGVQVDWGGPTLILKGDLSHCPDPPVHLEQVVARVSGVVRAGDLLSYEHGFGWLMARTYGLLALTWFFIDQRCQQFHRSGNGNSSSFRVLWAGFRRVYPTLMRGLWKFLRVGRLLARLPAALRGGLDAPRQQREADE